MSIVVDAAPFNRMCRDLSRISGKDFDSVLVDQVAQLLSVCIRYTHAAGRGGIERSVRFKNSRISVKGVGTVSKNLGGEDRVWFIEKSTWNGRSGGKPPRRFGEKSAHLMNGNRRWSNERWARFQALERAMEAAKIDVKKAVKSRGLTKATWLQIADALSASDRVKAPGYVRGATTFKGEPQPKIGGARRIDQGGSHAIEISNASRILLGKASGRLKPRASGRGKSSDGLDGVAILQRALRTRAAAFRNDLKRGVFDDVTTRAKRYPGIFTL